MLKLLAKAKTVALSPDVEAAESALLRAVVRRLVATGAVSAAIGVLAERLLA